VDLQHIPWLWLLFWLAVAHLTAGGVAYRRGKHRGSADLYLIACILFVVAFLMK